ncbi:Bsp6I family type II restriction endonuclease [Gallibacterium genomosp. 3]|uniref:Bsp6I family type II restriction endonuclease n=1 Tax=Gallibacterium genomosp. 3 TaxID=505345 RepID=UPI0008028114|nr:Bsp6I family type II restriction endonuclease [Gallibacterium genomosp. 3]
MKLKKLGLIIKRQRNLNHMSQAELAEKSNLSVNYIGDIENGRKSISLDAFMKVSIALNLRADQLLKFYFEDSEERMTIELQTIKKAYQSWKSLNQIISGAMHSRKVNLPEAISENIACYALGYERNMDRTGDARDEFDNLIEIKATANFNSDLSSFSPDTHFDKLIFVRLNLDEDKAYIYDLGLNGEQFGQLTVNRNETVADQQRQNRRPRLSLVQYIQDNGLNPITILDLR